MKKRKKTLQKICSILVLMVLTLTSIKAAGGSIAIDLKDLPQAEVEKAGVTFTLYKVGTMSDDGRAKLYERYGMSLPNTAEGLQKTAKELMERSGKEKVGKQVTDANGHLSFDDIGNGIYLLVPSDMETYGAIDPFLVTLPMYEELGSGIQGPSYDLQIEPKASPNKEPIEPTPPLDPDEPNPPLKPEEPDIPTDSDHPNGPHKPQTPETPDTSTTTDGHEGPKKDVTTTQTGDASRKGLYALLIMLSAFGMYIVYSKHRRGSELSDEK